MSLRDHDGADDRISIVLAPEVISLPQAGLYNVVRRGKANKDWKKTTRFEAAQPQRELFTGEISCRPIDYFRHGEFMKILTRKFERIKGIRKWKRSFLRGSCRFILYIINNEGVNVQGTERGKRSSSHLLHLVDRCLCLWGRNTI